MVDIAAQVCLHAVGSPRFQQTPSGLVEYDEATLTLLTESADSVSCKPLHANSRQSAWEAELGAGETVKAMRPSLDGAMLAVQRSPAFLQVVHVRSGNMFVQGPKSKAQLLNFFWVPSSACELVMATSQGLELYRRLPTNQGLHFMGSKKHSTAWCIYSHEARIALLAAADSGHWLQAYQFTNDAVLKLPPFQLQPPSPPQAGATPPGQQVSANNIRILTIYGRVYCAYLDYKQQRMSLYRFYKDAVTLQHTYDIYSQQIDLSVHDNVLLVHHLDSSTVMVLDVRARTEGPIASPLPLYMESQQQVGIVERGYKDGQQADSSASTASSSSGQNAFEPADYLNAEHWRFKQPNVVLDAANGQMWRCELNIAGVARTCSDSPLLLGFLQRRQQALHPQCDIKALLLSIVKAALLEQQEIHTIQRMCDALASGAAEAYTQRPRTAAWITVSPGSRNRAARLSMPVLTPQEVEMKVLRWLHDEEATGVQYLEAALAAYMDSCARLGLQVPSGLHLLALDIALMTSPPYQVARTLKQAGAAWDSADMAGHLEQLARRGTFPPGWHAALDMYTRLKMHDRYCQMLLTKGLVVQAIARAQQCQVKNIRQEAFVAKAAETGDRLMFQAVCRACLLSQDHIDDNLQGIVDHYRAQMA